jgi:hypothetical protein
MDQMWKWRWWVGGMKDGMENKAMSTIFRSFHERYQTRFSHLSFVLTTSRKVKRGIAKVAKDNVHIPLIHE